MTNHQIAKAAASHQIPRIVSPRGMLEPWAMRYRRWKKSLAWLLYQRRDLASAAALHATSETEANSIRNFKLGREVFVVPNGVTLPQNMPKVREASAPNANQTSSPEARIAVFLSRVHPKKGLPLLVEAWSRVRPEGWKMHVIGPDECGHRGEIESLARRLKLEESWHFFDSVEGNEKWRRLSEAELMILPTYSENFGNVIAESLAVATPVITTTGTPWQGLEQRQCGWWVSPNSDQLEHALRAATSTSKEELQKMGIRGQEWINAEFSWDRIAAQMVEIYKSLLSKATPA